MECYLVTQVSDDGKGFCEIQIQGVTTKIDYVGWNMSKWELLGMAWSRNTLDSERGQLTSSPVANEQEKVSFAPST